MASLLQSQRTAESNRKRVITPEYRERLRLSHLGQTPWNKGIKGSASHMFGRKMTSAQIEAVKARTSGAQNHFWKGGVTEINKRIRQSSEYKKWRTAVFERDNYTCQDGGERSGNGRRVELHPDHIKPFSLFPELRFVVSNGRTLCAECHRKTATYGSKIRNYKS